MMKELDMNVKESPFYNFLTSRYSMTFRINVSNAWDYAEDNDLSFFIVSLGALLEGLNSVDELRRRILDDKAVEYDSIDAITPLMNKGRTLFREMRVSPVKNQSFKEWHDEVMEKRDLILNGGAEGFVIAPEDRDPAPIANFSCIPWIDFDSMTNCIAQPNPTMPLITWGKVNENMEMSVAISVSHIFVDGRTIADFYENTQEIFNDLSVLDKK